MGSQTSSSRVIPNQVAPWIIVTGGVHRYGGTDRANYALVEYLLERRIPVHVVANQIDRELRIRPGLHAHAVPRPGRSWLLGEQLLWMRGHAIASKLTRRNPLTRVVVNGGNCPWADINWVHYVHRGTFQPAQLGTWPHRLKSRIATAVALRKEALGLRIARVVVTNSEATRRHVVDNVGISPAKVHTVHLGAEDQWTPPSGAERAICRTFFNQPPERPLVAFVGAIGHDQRKGLDTLWLAWNLLCQDPKWDGDLFVAGDGPALPHWRRVIESSPFRNRVRLLGFTKQVSQLLGASDLLVSPARYESFGLNVQEALCRGVPAIVSASAGVAERYSSELHELLLPDAEDFNDLAARIRRWRANQKCLQEQTLKLSHQLRRYDWAHMADSFYNLAMKFTVQQRNK
jgi:glycosyltransferase involved in cell wall biosynthesis